MLRRLCLYRPETTRRDPRLCQIPSWIYGSSATSNHQASGLEKHRLCALKASWIFRPSDTFCHFYQTQRWTLIRRHHAHGQSSKWAALRELGRREGVVGRRQDKRRYGAAGFLTIYSHINQRLRVTPRTARSRKCTVHWNIFLCFSIW